jgi:hypothetical protein
VVTYEANDLARLRSIPLSIRRVEARDRDLDFSPKRIVVRRENSNFWLHARPPLAEPT